MGWRPDAWQREKTNVRHPASLLLVFHGSRAPRASETARELCERLRRADAAKGQGRWRAVEGAWIQFGEPNVTQALERMAAGGDRLLVVAPILALPGRHLEEDLPRAVEAFRSRYPQCAVHVMGPLASLPGLAELLLQTAAAACDDGSGPPDERGSQDEDASDSDGDA